MKTVGLVTFLICSGLLFPNCGPHETHVVESIEMKVKIVDMNGQVIKDKKLEHCSQDFDFNFNGNNATMVFWGIDESGKQMQEFNLYLFDSEIGLKDVGQTCQPKTALIQVEVPPDFTTGYHATGGKVDVTNFDKNESIKGTINDVYLIDANNDTLILSGDFLYSLSRSI